MGPVGQPISLERFERASTTEQVVRALRKAIVEGRIAQGEPLREATIADTLGTGRGAVREAIRQLVQEGLACYEVHRGASVRVISLADRLDVYVAREAIETEAARRVLESAEAVDLAPLRAALEQMRAAGEDSDGFSPELLDADVAFHQALVGLAGSERLGRAYETLAAEARMLLVHQPPYPTRDYLGDHERLLDAIERRDPAAPELVAQHLRRSARLIAGQLARRDAAGPNHQEEHRP